MAQQRVPFAPFTPIPSQVTTVGSMSYTSPAFSSVPCHTPFPSLADLSDLPPEPSYHDISVATHKQLASLQAKLDRKLGPEYISQRPGPGGGPKLTYAEGWKIINLANEVFGFNGWSSSICSLNVDYLDGQGEGGHRWNCGVTAVVRVTLRDGVYHEDIGYGAADNMKNKSAVLEKCKKEAVTDAIKRTLRNFGNLLGNCLYDKQYTQEIVKIKVQPPKFDRDTLHRRPEFEEGTSRGGASIKSERNVNGSVPPAKRSNMPPPPLPPAKSFTKANAPVVPQVKSETDKGIVGPPGYQPFNPAQNANSAGQQSKPPCAPRSETSSATSSVLVSPDVSTVIPPLPQEDSGDPDEAMYFNSEDDALFMQLNVEEAGGLMIEEDRPIDYEDDATTEIPGTSVDQVEPHLLEERSMLASGSSTSSRPIPIPNPKRADVSNQPRQESRPPQHQANAAPQMRPQEKPQQRLPHTRPSQAQANRRQQVRQQHQPQNQTNQDQLSKHQPSRHTHSLAATSSRTTAPSTGNFHLPPGMNLTSRSAGLSAPIAVAGAKRKADGTTSSIVLHQSNNANPTGGQRVPLAPLDLGEGGDLKRVKR